jgi:hypothetical protein
MRRRPAGAQRRGPAQSIDQSLGQSFAMKRQ